LEERVGGQTTVQYVWSPVYVDAMLLRDRDSDGDGTLDERLWVVQDANFNVTAVVDGSGEVVERYVYDPFGQATVLDAEWNVRSGGSAYDWLYLHQGGRYDVTSGLYHFRFRDYSPTLGRWTSLDPLSYAAGDVNLYRTVGNDPLNSLDPSGLDDDIPLPDAVAVPLPNPRLPVLSSPPPASASGPSGGGWWYPGKYLLWRYREWWREWELDAQLDEVQRRLHNPAAAVMSQSSGGTWSVRGTYNILDPAFERNWSSGVQQAASLATVAVVWNASVATWVSPSNQQFVWTGRGWWNKSRNRPATAAEAKAAYQATAANRTMSDAFSQAKYAAGIPRGQQPSRQWTIRGPDYRSGAGVRHPNPAHHGRIYEYEIVGPGGQREYRYIIVHDADPSHGGIGHVHVGIAQNGPRARLNPGENYKKLDDVILRLNGEPIPFGRR
jgi:RHS repeat-associated protein